MSSDSITRASDVALPIEDVVLAKLKKKDGSPVVIRCEYADEVKVVQALESLPGSFPTLGIPSDLNNVETVKDLLRRGLPLLEIATVILGDDGSEIRPAFFINEDPKNGAIPARFLSTGDKTKLIVAILRVSGFLGETANAVSFRSGEREGSASGAGTVDARAGDGLAPGGTPPREDESDAPPPP